MQKDSTVLILDVCCCKYEIIISNNLLFFVVCIRHYKFLTKNTNWCWYKCESKVMFILSSFSESLSRTHKNFGKFKAALPSK